jgi:molybdate transport system substrate-binding protein
MGGTYQGDRRDRRVSKIVRSTMLKALLAGRAFAPPFSSLLVSIESRIESRVAAAAEINILSGSAAEPAMTEIIPKFERSSGHKVTFDYGTVGGMAERIQKGEVADLAIVSGPQIEMLEKQGKIVAGSRIDLGTVGIGVFVRKGASKPDVSSVEAFKRTMLAAKSIGYNDPAAGAPVGIYLTAAMERLGIAADMQPKTTAFQQRSERFGAVTSGDVEIGFNQISEILVASGVEFVGPLPAEIQNYTLFTAGIVASSKEAGRQCTTSIYVVARLSGDHEGKGFRGALSKSARPLLPVRLSAPHPPPARRRGWRARARRRGVHLKVFR